MSLWNDQDLRKLFLKKTPLIDVRSPCEFLSGSVPHSLNLPIMNDEERVLVGTCYKEQGQEAAIKLGHALVSGKIKEERIENWRDYIRRNPETEVFCFRGGLRSQISCQWIDMKRNPIPGGYKRMRQFFTSLLEESPLPELIRIGGPTGSAKSEFIKKADHIDIEVLAHHRGSAFGSLGTQPSQASFENKLAYNILEHEGKKLLIEDESAVLGKIAVPRRFHQHLRQSSMVVLLKPMEERVKIIYDTYVQGTDSEFFLNSLERIKKSLGGVNYEKIKKEMNEAFLRGKDLSFHEGWITYLLKDYYDPLYNRDIERQGEKVLMRGSEKEISEYLRSIKFL